MDEKCAQYAKYELSASLDGLQPQDRAAVFKLVEAAEVVNEIFAQQHLGGKV